MLEEQELESPEERVKRKLEEFSEYIRQIVSEYEIYVNKHQVPWIESQRIAYLCSLKLIQIFDEKVGFDAEYTFVNWAKERKLRCQNKIRDRECWPNGKPKEVSVYPSSYRQLYPGLSFDKFISAADEIILPKRQPIICRVPLIYIRRCSPVSLRPRDFP